MQRDTYPRCVLLQVTSPVLDGVWVAKLLQELHLFDDVLPFLHTRRTTSGQTADRFLTPQISVERDDARE